jgi:hypothetical protein
LRDRTCDFPQWNSVWPTTRVGLAPSAAHRIRTPQAARLLPTQAHRLQSYLRASSPFGPHLRRRKTRKVDNRPLCLRQPLPLSSSAARTPRLSSRRSPPVSSPPNEPQRQPNPAIRSGIEARHPLCRNWLPSTAQSSLTQATVHCEATSWATHPSFAPHLTTTSTHKLKKPQT